MILQIVKIVIAAATALLGLWVIVQPGAIKDFTGVTSTGKRGLTEIRAGMGAFYLGLGAAPIVFNSPDMYLLLGVTYLLVGVVRTATMIIDRSFEASNYASIASEFVFGALLVL